MTLKVIPNENRYIEIINFPDGQPHVRYLGDHGVSVDVVMPIRNPKDLMILCLTVDALKRGRCHLADLIIPYFMGARSDRVINDGDSVCLEVVGDIINNFGFAKVQLLDIHSDKAIRVIKNSINVNCIEELLQQLTTDPEVVICPDYGAINRAHLTRRLLGGTQIIINCQKVRDHKTGKITLTVVDPQFCDDKHCVIVDDICDGGGTFLAIAEQIKPKSLALVVTHGIFSKGFEELKKHFQQIVTTNSFKEWPTEPVTPINYQDLME